VSFEKEKAIEEMTTNTNEQTGIRISKYTLKERGYESGLVENKQNRGSVSPLHRSVAPHYFPRNPLYLHV
jgi:hypothetical protein